MKLNSLYRLILLSSLVTLACLQAQASPPTLTLTPRQVEEGPDLRVLSKIDVTSESSTVEEHRVALQKIAESIAANPLTTEAAPADLENLEKVALERVARSERLKIVYAHCVDSKFLYDNPESACLVTTFLNFAGKAVVSYAYVPLFELINLQNADRLADRNPTIIAVNDEIPTDLVNNIALTAESSQAQRLAARTRVASTFLNTMYNSTPAFLLTGAYGQYEAFSGQEAIYVNNWIRSAGYRVNASAFKYEDRFASHMAPTPPNTEESAYNAYLALKAMKFFYEISKETDQWFFYYCVNTLLPNRASLKGTLVKAASRPVQRFDGRWTNINCSPEDDASNLVTKMKDAGFIFDDKVSFEWTAPDGLIENWGGTAAQPNPNQPKQ